MELIELLKQSMLFSGLNDPDLAELATITVRRKFRKGESLFGEGDEATGFYLLVAGSLKLCRVAHDGREKVLHFVRPGETFAEAARRLNLYVVAGTILPEIGEDQKIYSPSAFRGPDGTLLGKVRKTHPEKHPPCMN